MEPITYESTSHTISTLTWPEASTDDLIDLVGSKNVNVISDGVQIKNGEGEWFGLRQGWAVSIDRHNWVDIMSPNMLTRKYRKIKP